MSYVKHMYRGEPKGPSVIETDKHCVVYMCSVWSVDVHVGTT